MNSGPEGRRRVGKIAVGNFSTSRRRGMSAIRVCDGASVSARVLAKLFKLEPPTHRVDVQRNLPVVMRDGTTLSANRFHPRGAGSYPTVLVRTPYKRSGSSASLLAVPYAQRGFNVILQSCRGTDGSEGQGGLHVEREDGLDTIEWLKRQPWYEGSFGMVGLSYMGMTQWAVAVDADPELKAIVPAVTMSDGRFWADDGTFWLDLGLRWASAMDTLGRSKFGLLGSMPSMLAPDLRGWFNHLPLGELGAELKSYGFQIWSGLTSKDGGTGEFAKLSHGDSVPDVTAATHLISGWYDMFIVSQLMDYQRMSEAGNVPYLTIGPYNHSNLARVTGNERKRGGPLDACTLEWGP